MFLTPPGKPQCLRGIISLLIPFVVHASIKSTSCELLKQSEDVELRLTAVKTPSLQRSQDHCLLTSLAATP